MSLIRLPLELKTLILREVFKGAEIQLATPFSLPHVQQLIRTNKALAVFAFKGLVGNIAEEILLQEAIFTFTELAKFEEDDLTQIKQVARIAHIAAKPKPSEFEATIRCLWWFKSLKDVNIAVSPRMTRRPQARLIPLWTANEFKEQEGISLKDAARMKRKFVVSLDIEYEYKSEGVEELRRCKARVSEGRLIRLDAPDDEEVWRKAIIGTLMLDKE